MVIAAESMVIDAQGIALVLGAIGVLLASIGTFIVQIVGLMRQTANKADTDKKLEVLHAQGDGNLTIARQLSEALGVEKGRQIGTAAAAVAAAAAVPAAPAAPMQVEIVSIDTETLPLPVEVVEAPLAVTVVEPGGKPATKKKLL